jgi:5'-nucleotidase
VTRILVDLDDTIADWSGRFDRGLDARPDTEGIRRSCEQTGFSLFDGHTPAQKRIIREVLSEPGFYSELEPIPGALEAIYQMDEEGYEIFIVTSPWVSNPTCASDKLRWIERYLGTSWSGRTIITSDKTVVRGDVLFDDKGHITGADEPTWEQVLITQPHNRALEGRVRLSDWTLWREAMKEALQ